MGVIVRYEKMLPADRDFQPEGGNKKGMTAKYAKRHERIFYNLQLSMIKDQWSR